MDYKKSFYTLLGSVSLYGFYLFVETNKNAALLVAENQKALAVRIAVVSEQVIPAENKIESEPLQSIVVGKQAAKRAKELKLAKLKLAKLKSGKQKSEEMYYKNKKHFDDASFEEMGYAIEKEFKKIYDSDSL